MTGEGSSLLSHRNKMEFEFIEDIASLEEFFRENEECFIVPYIEKHFKEVSFNFEFWFMKNHLFFTKKIIHDEMMSNMDKQNYLLDSLSFGKSKIVIIEGGRGAGKTATASWIIDELHERNMHKKIYFVKTGARPECLPDWITHVEDMDEVPNYCLAIVDESAIKYNSRNSWSDENKDFVKRLVILRHKGISIILITQHMKMLEIGARRLADIKIYKKGANLTNEDEAITDEKRLVRQRLKPIKKKDCLVEIPINNSFFKFEHDLPEWFNDTFSRSFIDFNPEAQTKKNKAEKMRWVKEKYQAEKELELAKLEKIKELQLDPELIYNKRKKRGDVLDI